MKKALCVLLVMAVASPGFAFIYSGRRHYEYQMPWTFNFNNRGTPDCTNEFTELTTALATWSNVSNQWYRQQRGSDTDWLNYGYDSYVLAVWYHPSYQQYGQGSWPWSSNAIAVNVYWYSGDLILHNDVCFNNYNFTWSDSGQAGRMDVQNIAAHEFGHNLCLSDIYESYASEYTMYGYSSYGETKKRTLEQDDINGIRYIYGYPGVKLSSFTATAKGGDVAVEWRTSSEVNLAGFNLYRMETTAGDGSYVKLNKALIRGHSPYVYNDRGLAAGTYKYKLEAVDLGGKREQFGPISCEVGRGTKATFALAACYPNPARERVTMKFTLPAAGEARLRVYDLSGRLVAEPAAGEMAAGEHEVVWTVGDVAPGVYIYRLETADNIAARRLVVTR